MMLRRPAIVSTLLTLVLALPAAGQPQPPAEPDPIAEQYQAARALADAERLDEAAAAFAALLEAHPEHPTAVYSARLLLDLFNRQGDYAKLREWVDRMLADSTLLAGDPKLAGELAAIDLAMRRHDAEALERDHRYDDCGRAYLELHARQPRAPHADELLYNAGVCFEAGGSMGAALSAYRLLERSYPQSALVRKALVRTARGYQRIAHYPEAADALERYVKRFPGEDDAPEALTTAMRLRRALGMPAKVRALAEQFAKLYGRRRPRQTAELLYATLAGDDSAGASARIEGFLKKWGSHAGAELKILAQARLGQLLWQRSCPKSDDPLAGCVAITMPPAKVKRCNPRHPVMTVRPRNAKLAARGRTALSAAVTGYGKLPPEEPDAPDPLRLAVDHAFAGARFALAQQDYEAFVALEFPTGLDFDPNQPKVQKASVKRFKEWIDRKQALMEVAVGNTTSSRPRVYHEIVAMGDRAGPWRVAASARIGSTSLAFSRTMTGAEIPADVVREPYAADKIDAFCDAMYQMVDPLEEIAAQSFETCISYGDSDPARKWLRWCEAALTSVRPLQHPRFQERYGAASHFAPVLSLEPLLEPAPAAP